MKRSEFLRDFVGTTGGLLLVACNKDLMDEFTKNENLDTVTIAEAEEWFNKSYRLKYASSRIIADDKPGYKRNAKWNSAKSMKDNKKQDYVWVPIDYDTTARPCIVTWDEKTAYRKKMAKQFALPIMEGLIVVKEKGKMKAFLAQIAYDPIAARYNGNQISKKDFTGWLMRCDWEDTLIDGEQYKKGEKIAAFDGVVGTKNGRTAQCRVVEVSYQTVEVSSCGPNCTEITVTLHRSLQLVCDGTGGGAPATGLNPDWFNNSEWSYMPISVPPVDTTVRSFNPTNVVMNSNSPDRSNFNQILNTTVSALGLAVDITGFSLDKGEAIARSIGANYEQFFPLAGAVGKRVGGIGVVLDGYQVFVGVKEGNFEWNMNSDLGNLIQLSLGVASLFVAPWVAVGFGAVSIGIAVYGSVK